MHSMDRLGRNLDNPRLIVQKLAKQRGAYRGRKKSLSPEQAAQLRQRVQTGERKAPLSREFSISRETLYQYLCTEDDDSLLPICRHWAGTHSVGVRIGIRARFKSE